MEKTTHCLSKRRKKLSLLDWRDLKNFLDNSPARYFEKNLKFLFLPCPFFNSLSSLENFDPSEKLWNQEFWRIVEKMENLKNISRKMWISSLEKIIEERIEEDRLENHLYSQKRLIAGIRN